ncbi:hypothetical protein SAMN05216271_3060 [Halopseudomonas sabulinigri]|uniref:Pyridoxamine 5'-phosphate oxidase N-terminal domain-containing protein n=1 Tax=Halopseudomonas sabulinigri TaxID=472181 RepID=A0A1H1W0V9_9GAMM|nr:MSMEG_1061 family FMN-dependent PPOX-type flavoprotein [Halopseudomonas sabulinigri]SDS90673.1 hypothetical protein SAMN05216271_3060 [Halopseudomonas sabulinigri]
MKVQSMEQLRSVLGEPHPLTASKIYDHLNPSMCEFIAQSPLLMMSTVDRNGFPTVSPKGDDPGFVMVDDDLQLLIPERKGNKMALSFANILAGSRLGLLFLVPGVSEVLRVQGEAEILIDPVLNARLSSKGREALLVTRLRVSEAYFHCGKALLRSRLWAEDLQHSGLRISFGEQIAGNTSLRDSEVPAFDAAVQQRYDVDV